MRYARVEETEKFTRYKYPRRMNIVITIDKLRENPKILNTEIKAAYKQPICSPLTAKRCIVPEFMNIF